MVFAELIGKMTAAAVAGNGREVADCFTDDGIYHDVFYGAFIGDEIVGLIENYFHRDATNFRWDLFDAIEQDNVGYCHYIFSYDSKLASAAGQRAGFEGIIHCQIQHGKIQQYREVATAVTGLHMLGFGAEKLEKFVARETAELTGNPKAAGHFN